MKIMSMSMSNSQRNRPNLYNIKWKVSSIIFCYNTKFNLFPAKHSLAYSDKRKGAVQSILSVDGLMVAAHGKYNKDDNQLAGLSSVRHLLWDSHISAISYALTQHLVFLTHFHHQTPLPQFKENLRALMTTNVKSRLSRLHAFGPSQLCFTFRTRRVTVAPSGGQTTKHVGIRCREDGGIWCQRWVSQTVLHFTISF